MAEKIVSMHAGFSSGGEFVDAYLSRPLTQQPRPSIVLVSGYKGLNSTQREITRRFAKAGLIALSPDLFRGKLPASHDEGIFVKNSLDIEKAIQEIVSSAQYLKKFEYVGGKVAVCGFCMGGGLALYALTRSKEFSAGVIYYHSIFPEPEEIEAIEAPMIHHYGTADRSTPRSEVDIFREAVEKYGKRCEFHTYEGASHAFSEKIDKSEFDRRAAEESWERTIEFLQRHLF